jgi:hypothetical protein
MRDDPMSATQLMDGARPFAADEFDQACDDEVGRRVLAAILRDKPELHTSVDVVGATPAARSSRARRTKWTYPASVIAVAAAIAVLIAVALTGRADRTAPDEQPGASAVQTSASPPPPRSVSPSAATHTQAQAAVRECRLDVGGMLGRMIASYRQPGGGGRQALARLRSTHAPSSIEYQRDAAAFDDWLARGGPAGKVTIAAVVGHACVQ